MSSISFSSDTDHSAQPEYFAWPNRHDLRYLTKTVPEETGVGGVPHMTVIGLLLSVTVYLSADSCSVVYSCASSITRKSNPSPSPPLDVLVRNWIIPPVSYSSMRSWPFFHCSLLSVQPYPVRRMQHVKSVLQAPQFKDIDDFRFTVTAGYGKTELLMHP